MSQSDYLKYKKVTTQLRIDASNNLSPVFAPSDYLNYKQMSLENSITNSKTCFNRVIPTNYIGIFDMDKKVTYCPSFNLCINTNKRPNRIPMSTVYFTPTPHPNNIKIVNEKLNLKTACKCKLSSKYTDRNSCKCALGDFGIVR
jgi:hypothetical protein